MSKKILASALAAASVAAMAAPAQATVTFNQIENSDFSPSGSDFFGADFDALELPGPFSHQFDFILPLNSSANSVVSTIMQSNDIDFTSIFLDGFAFTLVDGDPGAEVWELNSVGIGSGPHTIFVNGTLIGTNDQGASYSGTLNVSAVPEPATWAMLILGFGLIGGAMRSRQRQAVRYNFA